jgi:hypothetical protein
MNVTFANNTGRIIIVCLVHPVVSDLGQNLVSVLASSYVDHMRVDIFLVSRLNFVKSSTTNQDHSHTTYKEHWHFILKY